MTGRDLRWRAAGLLVSAAACAGTFFHRDGSPLTIVSFLLAIVGIVLMLHGKRVAVALRAERRGHCQTAAAIHTQRMRRQERRPDRLRH
ncbi:hypothetical protein [Sphingomonas desiccabilis]|uniref:Uncharacterized protein n=1 Tax=Sphingomonas desiccabilis TaxID=429134 RepID=A0A4Q2IKX0_9SPHN|nr:hypothetical protein [Sphingomonas desiccabilis]MBB3912612.1 hypothetical protein [Sphingomonas desiccabilis]RXZ29898.1 hypothetical protein EO081_16280 [Sphingomonas desiccabilis]